MNKLFYPAIFHREGDGFWVTFPDFPECFTKGDDMESAYEMAIEALSLAIMSRKAENQELPTASPADTVIGNEGSLVLVPNDLFYSKDNMECIEKSVQQIREGKVVQKTIEELEAMENLYILILRHKKLEVIKLENVKEQFFVFKDRETLETWLLNNGFLFGHCDGFANVPGKFYWFHQKDTPMDMVEIEIQTHKIIDEDTIADKWIEELMYRSGK